MKTIFLFFLVFVVSFQAQSQSYSELVFNKELSKLTTENLGYSPTVFEVINKEYKDIKKTSKKGISQAYLDAVEFVNLAKTDSVVAAIKVESVAVKRKEIGQIRGYIDKFLKSTEMYDSKKGMLKNAQKLSTKYNMDHLIYADSEVNNSMKAEFFVLSMDIMELKIHLKKILWKMDDNVMSDRGTTTNTEANNALKESREYLESVDKYEIIQGKPKVKTYNVLTLGGDILNPEEEILGHFESLGEYYVLTGGKGYKTDQLVSVEEVEKKKISDENFVFEISVVLIQHSISKSKYIVSPGFLDQYAINRIASQGKFKGKTAFPKKIYRSKKDKVYDSLILGYNKSHIASTD